tara:strand:+ start:1756 stop:2388 length:633 start_codon:yes stop_codon:yes gene_type:complete
MDNYLNSNNINIIYKRVVKELKQHNIDIQSEVEKYKKIVKKYMISINNKLNKSEKNIELTHLIELTVIKITNDLIKKNIPKVSKVSNSLDELFSQNSMDVTTSLVNETDINEEVSMINKKRGYNSEDPIKRPRTIKLKYLSHSESIEKILEYINKQELTDDTFLKTIRHIYKEGYYLDIPKESKINLKNFILGVKNKEKDNMIKLLEEWI